MNIIFKIADGGEQEVKIINKDNGLVMGRIFTPSGTSEDRVGAIQVCGFDDCFDFWGCGIYGDGEGNPKKDIQLLFNKNSQRDSKIIKDCISVKKCDRCFCYYRDENGNKNEKGKCKCDEFRVKEFKEIVFDNIKEKQD